MQANDLERALVERFLGDPRLSPSRRSLRWNAIGVETRNISEIGFLTTFEPSPELNVFADVSLRWGNVGARLNAVGTETGYLVYVDSGRVTAVEGHTYDGEQWPSLIESIEWYELTDGMELKTGPRDDLA